MESIQLQIICINYEELILSKTKHMRKVKIYTDGGCDPNPGPGGWGYVILDGENKITDFGGDPDTTNNRMEITAVLEAMKTYKEPVMATVYSDSKYVVNSINSWLSRWIHNDFKDNTIKNAILWKEMWELMKVHRISAYWVKGHSGIKYNEMADKLATKGRLKGIGVEPPPEPEEPKLGVYTTAVLEIPISFSRAGELDRLIKYLKRKKWDYKILQ